MPRYSPDILEIPGNMNRCLTQNCHIRLVLQDISTIYFRYKTDWVANKESGLETLDPNSSVTPGPLYNTIRYNTVLDITLIIVGPQVDQFCYISLFLLSL